MISITYLDSPAFIPTLTVAVERGASHEVAKIGITARHGNDLGLVVFPGSSYRKQGVGGMIVLAGILLARLSHRS